MLYTRKDPCTCLRHPDGALFWVCAACLAAVEAHNAERAAKDGGFPAIGVELDERHCETTARRLEQGVLNW